MTQPKFSPKAPRRPVGAPAPVPPPRPAAGGGPASRPQSLVRRPVASLVPVRPGGRRPVPPPGRRPSPVAAVALALVLVGLFAAACGIGHATGGWPQLFRGPDDPPPREFPVLDPAEPRRIEIPSIGVRAQVHTVGLADDGSIAVPPLDRHEEAGWYEHGPTPGEFGPALIVGHADTRTGPSVFHAVPSLKPGATVEVVRRDRRVAVFRVNSVERFDKKRLPADRVYGDYRRPGLRLITCGGRWLGGGIGYADNIVVFASLVATRRA